MITEPKTPKNNRIVEMPVFLVEEIQHYIEKLYDPRPDDRLFPLSKSYLYRKMEQGSKAMGLQRIRVHDLRHTHASLLIDMGCTPLLVAERLGHERVQTTMDTYSHLYPNKQTEVVGQLDGLATKEDGYKNSD